MARYKAYNYRQTVLLSVDFEKQLVPGSLEETINKLVEKRMDTAIFDQNYKNDETGCTAYDPKVLLKIILYAYSRGFTTSREIERACRENVMFMALSCGQRFDHSTIAAFVTSMRDQIMPLFRDVLLICHEMDLLGGTVFALDGCKLPSNASKQWSGTIKELRKKKGKDGAEGQESSSGAYKGGRGRGGQKQAGAVQKTGKEVREKDGLYR